MFTTKSVPQRITQPTQLYTRSCDRKIEIIVFGKQRGTFFFPLYIFMCDGRALTQLNGVSWWAKGLCHATIGSPHFPQFFFHPGNNKKTRWEKYTQAVPHYVSTVAFLWSLQDSAVQYEANQPHYTTCRGKKGEGEKVERLLKNIKKL